MSVLNFLICSERSGSNFLTSLLNGHPQISAPPPSHLFRLFALNDRNYQPLTSQLNWNAFQNDVREAHAAMPGKWTTGFPETALKLSPESRTIGEVLSRIYECERRADGAKITFVKENQTYKFASQLLQNWPDCKFIFQVRDPRDVALSLHKTANMRGGIITATDTWIRDQAGTLKALESLEGHSVLQVRYEDILEDTVTLSRAMCEHLGVDFDQVMLTFHTSTRTQENAKLSPAWENLDKGVLKDNKRKFVSQLSDHEIEYIELRCYDYMEHFGYDCLSQVGELSPPERAAKATTLANDVRQPEPVLFESEADREMRSTRLALIERVKSRGGVRDVSC